MHLLFFLKLVSQIKDFYFNLSLAIMFEDSFVGLSLLVSHVPIFGVRRAVVARPDLGKISLDVAGGTTSSRSRKANVV